MYVVMYIVMFSEAPLPQYLNWLTVVRHCVKEICMCVSLGGTPFVLLVIMVLCIVISCVLWKMHSLAYLKIFAVSDTCCTCTNSDIQLLLSSWLVKYLAGFGKFSSNCVSGKMWIFGSVSSLSDIAAVGRGTLSV